MGTTENDDGGAVANGQGPAANGHPAVDGVGKGEEEEEQKKKKQKPEVVPIKPVVMDYAWGIRGMDSRVARYALESKILDDVDPDTPYAELWIG